MTSDRTAEERRWRLALESATFGVWDLDPRAETVHYASPWKARLGFPRIHAPDSTAFWRCRVHPADVDAMLVSLRAHLDGFSSSYEMRFRLRSNGSGYRTMLSRGRVIERDHRGDATRMVGTMVDLTGRPAAAASHGLPAEEPGQAGAGPHSSLHAALGVGSAGRERAHGVIDLIDDLLERALREGARAL